MRQNSQPLSPRNVNGSGINTDNRRREPVKKKIETISW